MQLSKDGAAIHDGYLFTLGIIGTPLGERPAARLLLGMIEALPPVKRVAALGDGAALYERVLDDMRDAELVLISIPAQAGGLPARLAGLLDYCAPAARAGLLRGKVAALAASGEPLDAAAALAALQGFCQEAGITVAASRAYSLIVDRTAIVAAQEMAQSAYRIAETRLPVPSLGRLVTNHE